MLKQGKPIKNNPLLDTLSKVSPKNYKEAIAMQTEPTYQEIAKELGESVGMVDHVTQMTEIAKKCLGLATHWRKYP
jgi:DNA-directed RNA polymerase sigma subunit (sigma70/sigma32)